MSERTFLTPFLSLLLFIADSSRKLTVLCLVIGRLVEESSLVVVMIEQYDCGRMEKEVHEILITLNECKGKLILAPPLFHLISH